MARTIRAICFGLAALALIVWIGGYLYVSGLACGFGNASSCGIRMPWQMRGEDLLFLVLLPGSVVLALLLVAGLAHRQIKASRDR